MKKSIQCEIKYHVIMKLWLRLSCMPESGKTEIA